MVDLSEPEKAYIAGIIDGEGCISVRKMRTPKTKTGVRYQASLDVGNTDKNLVGWLQKTTQVGSIRFLPSNTPTHKDFYNWNVSSQLAANLLKKVRPYMIIKQKQADIMCELAELQRTYIHKGPVGMSDEEYDYRNLLYRINRRLNRRGNAS